MSTPATIPLTAVEEVRALMDLGLAAIRARDLPAAHQAFERAHRRDPRHLRAMSWYGVTLVLVERNSALGVSLCEQAARPVPDAELQLNLARVHLALNSRERAVRALLRGLQADPGHPMLLAAQAAMGTRRGPVLALLSRDNPLNRLLGRLRHRWSRRHAPTYDLSPMGLGMPPAPGRATSPGPAGSSPTPAEPAASNGS